MTGSDPRGQGGKGPLLAALVLGVMALVVIYWALRLLLSRG